MSATEAESKALDSEAGRITTLAERRAVQPILSMRDLPTQDVFEHAGVRRWLMGHDDSLCVLSDGTIVSSDPRHPDLSAVTAILTRHDTTVVLRPAMHQVVLALREKLSDAWGEDMDEPARGGALDTDKRSQLQARLDSIFDVAYHKRATDIHVRLREDEGATHIRLRIDGRLRDYDTLSYADGLALAHLLFTIESDQGKGFSTTEPREGAGVITISGNKVPLRFSCYPVVVGTKLLVRLGSLRDTHLTLDNCGLSMDQVAVLRDAIREPHGLILIAGPVGSGKSTTLRSAIRELGTHLDIVSLEDPVEEVLPNCDHVNVDKDKESMTMASLQRSMTRWDADVNGLGEIRDGASATIARALVNLGRIVVGTVHAKSAVGIIARLEGMGVGRDVLSEPDFLRLLVYQRLIPTLCADCALEEAALPQPTRERWRGLLGEGATLKAANPQGCEHCDHVGFVGRELVAEIIRISDEDLEYIEQGNTRQWLRSLKQRHWPSIKEPTQALVGAGRVDPMTAETQVGFDDSEHTTLDTKEHR